MRKSAGVVQTKPALDGGYFHCLLHRGVWGGGCGGCGCGGVVVGVVGGVVVGVGVECVVVVGVVGGVWSGGGCVWV